MTVTIEVDRCLRVHLTAERATLVEHADGVPYRVEECMLGDFIRHLHTMRAAKEGT